MKVNKISAVAVRTRDGDYAKALYAITQQPCKERALRHRKELTSLMDTWTRDGSVSPALSNTG
jgi:hypothetical protein